MDTGPSLLTLPSGKEENGVPAEENRPLTLWTKAVSLPLILMGHGEWNWFQRIERRSLGAAGHLKLPNHPPRLLNKNCFL